MILRTILFFPDPKTQYEIKITWPTFAECWETCLKGGLAPMKKMSARTNTFNIDRETMLSVHHFFFYNFLGSFRTVADGFPRLPFNTIYNKLLFWQRNEVTMSGDKRITIKGSWEEKLSCKSDAQTYNAMPWERCNFETHRRHTYSLTSSILEYTQYSPLPGEGAWLQRLAD